MGDRQTIRQLQRELADLRRRLGRLEDRPPLVRPSQYTRLAKTVKDPVDDLYPDADTGANTFWIVFLDGSYTIDTDADLTPSWTPRQAVDDAGTTAHCIPGHWVKEGTIVVVTFHPGVGSVGQWWFSDALPGGEIVPIELKTDLAKFGGATVWHLDDDGLRTTTEETALDILGYYEGVGSDESGSPDGDKGACWRAADGRLKFLVLSCDPPGVNTVETPPAPPPLPDPEPDPEPDPPPMPPPI